MIVGLGIDLEEVDEIRHSIETRERYLQKIFTDQEIAYSRGTADPYQRFAARFAAKEAAMKALGTGWTDDVPWRDIEVVNNEATGCPALLFHGTVAHRAEQVGAKRAFLSLTHTPKYVIAAVVLER
jgi:holo-[acyl-carrier protein] synthase